MEDIYGQFLSLEKSHLAPIVRQSNAQLGQILDDEFFEFGSSGGVTCRADYKEDDDVDADDFAISRFEVRPLGPDAVLTMYLLENRTTGKWSHRSSIWKKRADGWKLFFHQGTKTDVFRKWE